jgi:hypothetical protein
MMVSHTTGERAEVADRVFLGDTRWCAKETSHE